MTTLTIKVEVAFNAGFSAAAASRTWTDITDYVHTDGIDIQFASRDEFSGADANTLRLTLDNSDGRFTPERSSSPYYPNVKLFRPIRVSVTLPDTSVSTRFLGYVTQWPTAWPDGIKEQAESELTASSRMARLGQTTQLRSMLENEVLVNVPTLYYPLGEAQGATTAANASTTSAEPLTIRRPGYKGTATPTVAFGAATGPSGDDTTAPTFNGTGVLGFEYGFDRYTGIVSVSAFVLISAAPPTLQANWLTLAYTTVPQFWVTPAGHIATQWGGATSAETIESATSYADARWHHVAAVISGGTTTLYVDGVSVASRAATVASYEAAAISIGGDAFQVFATDPFVGSIAHVAFYPSALTAAEVLDQYTFGLSSPSESTALRATRIAGYGSVPASEVSTSGAAVICGDQEASGKTVLEALRDVEDTEAGVLYDARDGTLTLTNRGARYGATSAFTLNGDTQVHATDLNPTYDETGVVNDVTVTGPSGSARITNQTSINDYGVQSDSAETLSTDEDEPMMLAGWAVNTRSDPKTRIGSLSVSLVQPGAWASNAVAIAGATVGTLITVNNMPTQTSASSAQYFVEGYTEHIAPESWVMTLNVSDASPYLNVFTLGDATLGQYDGFPLAL